MKCAIFGAEGALLWAGEAETHIKALHIMAEGRGDEIASLSPWFCGDEGVSTIIGLPGDFDTDAIGYDYASVAAVMAAEESRDCWRVTYAE